MNIFESSTPVAFLYIKDRERALAFYRGALGLELRSSDDFGDFLDLGNALARMTVLPDHVAGPHPVLGWNVGDISAVVKALRDRGVVFNIHEGMGQDASGIWSSPDGRSRVAFLSDPDGNVLAVSQA
jgi:catechol 2,3-dioxygenase-like lactoylglutathione lyase family enzyme